MTKQQAQDNITLAEFIGLKVFTGELNKKDFKQQMDGCDLCLIHADNTIIFNNGEKAGTKFNPFHNQKQADIIMEKIISENKGCIILTTTPKEKDGNWLIGLGSLVNRKDKQFYVELDWMVEGKTHKVVKYNFMLQYAKKGNINGK